MQTNCVVVWHGSPPHFTGRWDDRNCLEEKHGYICQRSIGSGGWGGQPQSLLAGDLSPLPWCPMLCQGAWSDGLSLGGAQDAGGAWDMGLTWGGVPGPSSLWGTPKPVHTSLALHVPQGHAS